MMTNVKLLKSAKNILTETGMNLLKIWLVTIIFGGENKKENFIELELKFHYFQFSPTKYSFGGSYCGFNLAFFLKVIKGPLSLVTITVSILWDPTILLPQGVGNVNDLSVRSRVALSFQNAARSERRGAAVTSPPTSYSLSDAESVYVPPSVH